MGLLDNIKQPNDIKKIDSRDYGLLADEIRSFLIDKVSKKGGHLASNLGSVELIMALHLAMDFPKDKLIFDVGHQSYTHKLLTGRRDGFDHLREYEGMSGFPKTKESDCDVFNTGHSSTSISAAMGFAVARDMRKSDERVVAVIGDGSLTGGMAYEAINSLSQNRTGCVIVLNDNDMSIDKNVGGLSKYLNEIRVGRAYNGLKLGVENSLCSSKAGTKVAKTLKRSKDSIKQLLVPGMFFEELGITYVGPVDGHDIPFMLSTFKKAFLLNKPIIIHVKTKKGKGYRFAERHPDYFHGVAPFDPETGKVIVKKETSSYTDIFSKHMVEIGGRDPEVVGVTAAMANGTGLSRFGASFPDRMYDVGIAEQHAVTFAAGMAAAGLKPVVAIYSSFLQRAYDQILHDVCLQNLHVIFAIDRTGIVGQDGETHQGIYDMAYLSHMPNMTIMAPKNRYELMDMLDFAVDYEGPVCIKYPRGDASKIHDEKRTPVVFGKSELISLGSRVLICSVGHMMDEADKLHKMLGRIGIDATLVNVRFPNMIDVKLFDNLMKEHSTVVCLEENVSRGGYGELLFGWIMNNCQNKDIKFIDGSIKEAKVEQGAVDILRRKLGIDAASLFVKIRDCL